MKNVDDNVKQHIVLISREDEDYVELIIKCVRRKSEVYRVQRTNVDNQAVTMMVS